MRMVWPNTRSVVRDAPALSVQCAHPVRPRPGGLAMATATTTVRGVVPGTKLRVGSLIMAIGGAGFIGYAIIFFVRNFTGFLELGIGRGEVSVSKTQISTSARRCTTTSATYTSRCQDLSPRRAWP